MLKQNINSLKTPINFDAICFHGEAKQRESESESVELSARAIRERKHA